MCFISTLTGGGLFSLKFEKMPLLKMHWIFLVVVVLLLICPKQHVQGTVILEIMPCVSNWFDGVPLNLTCVLKSGTIVSSISIKQNNKPRVLCNANFENCVSYNTTKYGVVGVPSVSMTVMIKQFQQDGDEKGDDKTWNCVDSSPEQSPIACKIATSAKYAVKDENLTTLEKVTKLPFIVSVTGNCTYLLPTCSWTYTIQGGSEEKIPDNLISITNTSASCNSGDQQATCTLEFDTVSSEFAGKNVSLRVSITHPSLIGDSTPIDIVSPGVIFPDPPPNAPEIKGYQTGTPVYENDTLSISCEVKGGYPLVSLVNLSCYGGQQSTSSRTEGDTVIADLSFQLNRSLNFQLCTCSASHVTNQYTKTDQENVTVYYPPSVPTLQPDPPGFPWLEGDQNKGLTCSVSERGNPPCTYVWSRDGVEDSSQTSSTWTFSSLSYSDNGRRFSCQAQNSYTLHKQEPKTSTNKTLDVYYHPRLTLSKSGPITKREGERLGEINCTVDSNPPNATISWSSNSSKQWTGDLPLQIPELDRGHHGTYTCKASTSSSLGTLTGTSQIKITVNYAPGVKVTGQATSEGNTMTVTCEAEGRPDSYTFHGFNHSWGDQFIRMVKGTKQGDRYVWMVQSASYEDSGVYQCSVDNQIPDRNNTVIQTNTTSVLVKGKPVITLESESDETMGEEIGHQVTMYKTVFSQENITKHQWTKNNDSLSGNLTETNITLKLFEKIIVSEVGYNITLTITTFNETDEGRYRLEVCNMFKCATFFTDLSAAGPPYVPSSFSAYDSTSDTVFLTWVAGFPGGHYTQRFLVEYKEAGRETEWTQQWYNDHAARNQKVYMNITGLHPGRLYVFRVLAENTRNHRNRSAFTSNITVETKDPQKAEELTGSGFGIGAAVGGAVGSVAVVGIIVLLVVFFVRRSRLSSKNKKDAENGLPTNRDSENLPALPVLDDNELYFMSGGSGDAQKRGDDASKPKLPVLEDNDLYFSSGGVKKIELPVSQTSLVRDGAQPSTSTQNDDKKDNKKGQKEMKKTQDDKKAEKNKKKKEQEKSKDKEKKAKDADKKVKKGKKDDKMPLNQAARGDAYENVDLGKDSTYANAAFDGKEDEVCQNVQGAKCGRDEDGLVYVGIDFSSTTPSKAVHKTEESVEYMSIDWNKKAQPLPDGDEPKEGKSQK